MNEINVNIYRSMLGDCTNEGLTSNGSEIFVSWPKRYGVALNGDPTKPFLELEISHHGIILATVPKALRPIGKVGPMFGGNFIASSDSRFRTAIRILTGREVIACCAIPVHDRFETVKEYARNAD